MSTGWCNAYDTHVESGTDRNRTPYHPLSSSCFWLGILSGKTCSLCVRERKVFANPIVKICDCLSVCGFFSSLLAHIFWGWHSFPRQCFYESLAQREKVLGGSQWEKCQTCFWVFFSVCAFVSSFWLCVCEFGIDCIPMFVCMWRG